VSKTDARRCGRIVLLLVLSGPPAAARGAGACADSSPALTTADLLVDLARDYGLRRAGRQTAADVLHVRTLLRAAARLEPSSSRAQVWLYDLALRSGATTEAADVLTRLVAADPGNTVAFGNWLELGPPEVQSAEQRRAWLEGLLPQAHPERGALVHVHLAQLALERADREAARQHRQAALRLWPECPDAHLLALSVLPADAPPAQQLDAVLEALAVDPLDAGLAWQAGALLDQSGFVEEARAFYEHALSVEAVAAPGVAPSPDRLLQLARNAAARGQRQEAVRYAEQAARAETGTYEARLYLYWLLAAEAAPEQLRRVREALAAQLAEIKEPERWPVNLVAQAAWFYCTVDEQPQRALLLAEHAAARAPGDAFVQRVLGWAQALSGQVAAARATLAPLAGGDAYAAYRLARLLQEAGEAEAASAVLRDLAGVPVQGRARELLEELGLPASATQPAAQRHPEIVALLADFDRDVLDFHKDPGRFVRAEIRLENPSPGPGEPWWLVASLTNCGSFPVTLGPGWMLNPVFLLSFRVEGQGDYPHLFTLSLERARVLHPGETLRVRETIDVGPLRELARRSPERLLSVFVSAILDPQQSADGSWAPGATGQRLRPIALARTPASVDPEAWHARFGALREGAGPGRFQALEVMAQLLGAQQRSAAKASAVGRAGIPVEHIQRALLAALNSDSWELRARALDALQAAGLDQALFDAAQRCLEHPHWAVRLLALRLLARQGAAFGVTARRIADEDPDELVRDLARSYAERWAADAAEAGSP